MPETMPASTPGGHKITTAVLRCMLPRLDLVHSTTSSPFPESDHPDYLSRRPLGGDGPHGTVFDTVLAADLPQRGC